MIRFLLHILLYLFSLAVSLPIVGFFTGVFLCDDCGWNPFYYLLIGVIHSLITTATPGNAWVAHDRIISVWGYIIPVSILLFWFIESRRMKKKDETMGIDL